MIYDVNRFHIFVLIAWQFILFFTSQLLFPIFSNYLPQWRCGNGPFGKDCDEFARCHGNVTFAEIPFNSAALEFNWICGSGAYNRVLFSQLQFVGVLLGTFIFGTLSDVFGRRPIAILSLSVGLSMNFATGLAPSWQILLGIRFFVGLAIGGTLVVGITLAMEMLLPQQRMPLRAFFNWGVARLIMTLICMNFNDWRQASMVCAITSLPALLIIIFVFPESPTWLHNKGRIDEMRASEKKMARIAGIEYVPVEHKKIEHNKSFCELIHTGNLFRRLLVLWCMWFTASTCAYATDFNSSSLSGNFFLNQILYAILIAGSKMVILSLDTALHGFTRRMLHQGAQSIVCVCFLVLTVLSIVGYTGVFSLIVNLMGTIFIEYTWDACYLCSIESMETSCRASAGATCSIMARFGALIAPFLNYLNTIWPPAVYLAVVTLGTFNLIVSYFFLVETKHVNLDDVTLTEDATEETEMIKKELEG